MASSPTSTNSATCQLTWTSPRSRSHIDNAPSLQGCPLAPTWRTRHTRRHGERCSARRNENVHAVQAHRDAPRCYSRSLHGHAIFFAECAALQQPTEPQAQKRARATSASPTPDQRPRLRKEVGAAALAPTVLHSGRQQRRYAHNFPPRFLISRPRELRADDSKREQRPADAHTQSARQPRTRLASATSQTTGLRPTKVSGSSASSRDFGIAARARAQARLSSGMHWRARQIHCPALRPARSRSCAPSAAPSLAQRPGTSRRTPPRPRPPPDRPSCPASSRARKARIERSSSLPQVGSGSGEVGIWRAVVVTDVDRRRR
ncbi:hypothetical protein C8R47DRAFT_530039 [Mycena vitilis]|nr:hypothetical protein C8R47DRAFT_530039 [Mycena vitilis]